MSFNLLAIETSSELCSVALYSQAQYFENNAHQPRQHAQLLLGQIDQLLRTAELNLADLNAIAFGQGPGSFTGLRLAASTAQGLAFALDLPVVPISSLRAMAQQVYLEHGVTKAIVISDARMNELYAGIFEIDPHHLMQAQTEEQLLPVSTWVDWLKHSKAKFGKGNPEEFTLVCDQSAFGEAQAQTHSFKNFISLCPTARCVAQLAEVEFHQGHAVSPELALPVYLREMYYKTQTGF